MQGCRRDRKEMKGKRILLGITGSIVAYKSAVLARLFVKAGAEVRVVMTESAKEFITPLTLSVLSKNPVLSQSHNKSIGTKPGMLVIIFDSLV